MCVDVYIRICICIYMVCVYSLLKTPIMHMYVCQDVLYRSVVNMQANNTLLFSLFCFLTCVGMYVYVCMCTNIMCTCMCVRVYVCLYIVCLCAHVSCMKSTYSIRIVPSHNSSFLLISQ